MSKKILIVEDDTDFTVILKDKFSKENFVVLIAQDGEEGFNMAEKDKPDLIIADILLPKMDGITMVKKIKDARVPCPIIFLTNTEVDKVELKGFVCLIKANTQIDQVVDAAKEALRSK